MIRGLVCFLTLGGLVGAMSTATADSMRCGRWVVNEASTVDELLSKCGQPQSRDITQEDTYTINPRGARVKTGGITVTERWIYKPTPGTLPMQVLVVNGRIMSLARAN